MFSGRKGMSGSRVGTIAMSSVWTSIDVFSFSDLAGTEMSRER
jgi:hypothetical protein